MWLEGTSLPYKRYMGGFRVRDGRRHGTPGACKSVCMEGGDPGIPTLTWIFAKREAWQAKQSLHEKEEEGKEKFSFIAAAVVREQPRAFLPARAAFHSRKWGV